jgi:hypothetical protein
MELLKLAARPVMPHGTSSHLSGMPIKDRHRPRPEISRTSTLDVADEMLVAANVIKANYHPLRF